MRLIAPDSVSCGTPGEMLSVSGPDLQMLLCAMISKSVSFRFRAWGKSMSPFIQDGDLVTVSPKAERVLEPGQVVAFCHPERRNLVIHRVISVRSGGYLIQGDNSPDPDGLIPAEDVLGVVTKVERDGRRVLLGWGPERRAIAFLVRCNLLQPLVYRAQRALRMLSRGSAV